MIDGFDIQLEKATSKEELLTALSNAYGISNDEINLQYLERYDLNAPVRKLFCLVTEGEGGDGGFPVLLTLSSCDTERDENEVTIASKISNSLGISCLISSGRPYDDDTRLLICGFEQPRLVLIIEEYDKLLDRSNYFLKDYESREKN